MIEVELDASIDPHSEEGKSALDAVGLCLGIGGIVDAFHRFKISWDFSSYFGLMELTAREAGVIGHDFGWGPVEAEDVIVPCFTSLPLGFFLVALFLSGNSREPGPTVRRHVCLTIGE